MTTTAPRARTDQGSGDPFQGLRALLDGTLITATHEEYDQARQIVTITVDRRPGAVVRVASTEDVARTIRFARANGYDFCLRSGGHDIMGRSTIDDGILIDLGGLRDVTVDPVSGIVRVQPGVTSNELGAKLGAYGLALTTGDTGSVGIGGLTVGGGFGWMSRKYGLTIDNLLEARMVTVEGEVLRAAEDENADLFWAIRGGGGNFGVITEFTFRAAPSGIVQGGVIVLPATRDVLRGYLDYVPDATEDLTTISFLMHAPPAPFIAPERIGEVVLMVGVTFTGDATDLESALAPIRALGTPLADTVDTIPYPVMFAYLAEAEKRHGSAMRTMFADDLSDAQIDAMIEAMVHSSSPFSMVQLRGLGGAISRVPADATAFTHRDARLMATIIGLWFDPEDDGVAHRAWTEDLWSHLAPASHGAYVNFLQRDSDDRQGEAYPDSTLARLREVKAKYDPENLFRFNNNIRPR